MVSGAAIAWYNRSSEQQQRRDRELKVTASFTILLWDFYFPPPSTNSFFLPLVKHLLHWTIRCIMFHSLWGRALTYAILFRQRYHFRQAHLRKCVPSQPPASNYKHCRCLNLSTDMMRRCSRGMCNWGECRPRWCYLWLAIHKSTSWSSSLLHLHNYPVQQCIERHVTRSWRCSLYPLHTPSTRVNIREVERKYRTTDEIVKLNAFSLDSFFPPADCQCPSVKPLLYSQDLANETQSNEEKKWKL